MNFCLVVVSDSLFVTHVRLLFLNQHCTYQAELSEGSDQEKAAYVLNTKQKVVKLIGQWVALCGILLKEDPIALDFLEVRLQTQMLISLCTLCIFQCIFRKQYTVYL